MGEHSNIEWTDATWNPITGCSVVSPGCTNCYAMRLAGTRLRRHPSRAGLTEASKTGPVWNGQVRLNEQWLDQPLRWRKPRRIFVCAHGDLFHENVPDEWIDRVFAVMALAPQHTFQVLTKRADRMRAYVEDACWRVAAAVQPLRTDDNRALMPLPHLAPGAFWWPLANVWLIVSAEDQARADARILDLLATPAAVRWVSAEPLLGPLDLERGGFALHRPVTSPSGTRYPGLDWIVVGGESAQNKAARAMDPAWARSIRDQCAAAGVAFFMKQMANKAPIPDDLMVRQWPAPSH